MSEEPYRDPEAEPRARLRALAADPALREETNLFGRSEAMDFLESLLFSAGADDARRAPDPGLMREAETLRSHWEALDALFFRRLREDLRAAPDPSAAFRRMLAAHVPAASRAPGDGPGYDALDLFLNGLLHPDPIPGETLPLQAGMVAYQKTPARIVLGLAERFSLSPRDVFIDVGAGLGQVPILIHLLTGARAIGVEREPAYAAYARSCALALGLPQLEFLGIDARAADYSPATALFLYTPFRGAMLEAVLERIRRQCRPGTHVFTYGPCTAEIARYGRFFPLGAVQEEGLAAFALP